MVLRVQLAFALLIGIGVTLQTPSNRPQSAPAGQPAAQQNGSANQLVKTTVQNELETSDHTHWMYQLDTRKDGVTETKVVVETPHGNLTRLVARNGRPLTRDEQKQEDEKIQKFVSDTGAQQKKRRQLDEDVKKTKVLFAMLPEALTYSYAGHEGNLTRLTFKPNPNFNPPSREATVFHAMEGEMVIDTKGHWLVEFSGHLTQPVKFGGGFLGDLEPGGSFDVRQQEVCPGHWDISLVKVNINGKALLFKSINVRQEERHSGFKRVPDGLTFAQANDLVKKSQTS